MATAVRKSKYTTDYVVTALSAHPPRIREASQALRWLFENPSDTPHTLLVACGQLLSNTDAVNPEILASIRKVSTEMFDYSETERKLFTACVYTSETRQDVAVTELSDITNTVRTGGQRHIRTALDAMRWMDATTNGKHRKFFTICAALLKNPSVVHPTVVDAIRDSRELWPKLNEDQRALVMSCIYASKPRAEHARKRRAEQQKAAAAESADVHRCRNCDGNLADTPDLQFCSQTCQQEAETTEVPDPANVATPDADAEPAPQADAEPIAPLVETRHAIKIGKKARKKREPAEKRAQRTDVEHEFKEEFDDFFREVVPVIPLVWRAVKDTRVVDAYDREQPADHGQDDRADVDTEAGWDKSEEDYENHALRPLTDAPGALCVCCNIERTPTEIAEPGNDGRCQIGRERNAGPLIPEWHRELAAA